MQNEAHYNRALAAAEAAWVHYKDVCLGIHHRKLSKETGNSAINSVIHAAWALKEAAVEPPAAPLPQRKPAKEKAPDKRLKSNRQTKEQSDAEDI